MYDDRDLDRRFKMRSIFQQICRKLQERSVFVHRRDSAGKLGINPEMRIIAGLRVMAYGMSYDHADEL